MSPSRVHQYGQCGIATHCRAFFRFHFKSRNNLNFEHWRERGVKHLSKSFMICQINRSIEFGVLDKKFFVFEVLGKINSKIINEV